MLSDTAEFNDLASDVSKRLYLSAYSKDFIADDDGNSISASLSGMHVDYAWKLGTDEQHVVLIGTYGNAEFFPENPVTNDAGWTLSIENSSLSLMSCTYDGETWNADQDNAITAMLDNG